MRAYCALSFPPLILSLPVVLVAIGLGLLLQIPIFLMYRSLGREKEYLKNKAGGILVAIALLVYFYFKYQIV